MAHRRTRVGPGLLASIGLSCAAGWGAQAATSQQAPDMAWSLSSPAFKPGDMIPAPYTCDGQDLSPPLQWAPPPSGTKSLALVSDDPDAPGGTWVHWIVYNLPPSLRVLPEAFPPNEELPDGTRQGLTSFGRTGYGGPCPPSGTHRYVFTLYALDVVLALPPRSSARQLDEAIKGHVLAQAELMGTYRR